MNSLSDLQSLLSEEQKQNIAVEKQLRDKQMLKAKSQINNIVVKDMDLQYFPAFVSTQIPNLTGKEKELLPELGAEFKKYLIQTFKGNLDKLYNIWDITPNVVITRKLRDPFAIKGYDAVFVLHYLEFIKKMKNEMQQPKENNNIPNG